METHMAKVPLLQGSVIAIGAFDGVHLGHQTVIRETIEKSKSFNVPSVVYTFDPPPRSYFQGVQVLTPLPEKLYRLAELGVDHAVVASFDESYTKRHPIHFVEELKNLKPMEVTVGRDFHFGKKREGDIHLLARHFQVSVIDPVCCSSGMLISSTRIRELMARGERQESISLLGWPLEHSSAR
jgi:riboflavin kinase / FMN adenylyltransferase